MCHANTVQETKEQPDVPTGLLEVTSLPPLWGISVAHFSAGGRRGFSSATVSVMNTADSTIQHSLYIHA